jgi:hypothetical protein
VRFAVVFPLAGEEAYTLQLLSHPNKTLSHLSHFPSPPSPTKTSEWKAYSSSLFESISNDPTLSSLWGVDPSLNQVDDPTFLLIGAFSKAMTLPPGSRNKWLCIGQQHPSPLAEMLHCQHEDFYSKELGVLHSLASCENDLLREAATELGGSISARSSETTDIEQAIGFILREGQPQTIQLTNLIEPTIMQSAKLKTSVVPSILEFLICTTRLFN